MRALGPLTSLPVRAKCRRQDAKNLHMDLNTILAFGHCHGHAPDHFAQAYVAAPKCRFTSTHLRDAE